MLSSSCAGRVEQQSTWAEKPEQQAGRSQTPVNRGKPAAGQQRAGCFQPKGPAVSIPFMLNPLLESRSAHEGF